MSIVKVGVDAFKRQSIDDALSAVGVNVSDVVYSYCFAGENKYIVTYSLAYGMEAIFVIEL